jgi:DNA-binding MarR family transcriptional regulator
MSEFVDAVSEQVLTALRQIIRAIDRQSKNLEKKYGLTIPQLVVLKETEKGRELTVGEIAKKVSLSQATVTTILDRLESRGLVERHRSSEDKRRVMVRTTPHGNDILKDSPSILQEHFLRQFGKLAEWEQSLILSSLQRIVSMMNAEDIEAVPHLMSGFESGIEQKK